MDVKGMDDEEEGNHSGWKEERSSREKRKEGESASSSGCKGKARSSACIFE